MIERFAKLIPAELNEYSGSVFYSGRNAFQGKKDLYIVGLNPGGSELLQKKETILLHTEKTLREDPNWSEYFDESWKGHKPGKFGLQPRILHLLKKLNLSPHDIPASNICFVRSSRESGIPAKVFNDYCESCWQFHEAVINELEIKIILCFGNTAGNFIRKKINTSKQPIDHFIESNNRKWKTQVYNNANGQVVIVAPHPSIADWTNEKTDPSILVKKYLNAILRN